MTNEETICNSGSIIRRADAPKTPVDKFLAYSAAAAALVRRRPSDVPASGVSEREDVMDREIVVICNLDPGFARFSSRVTGNSASIRTIGEREMVVGKELTRVACRKFRASTHFVCWRSHLLWIDAHVS
jgi:hypothetical protein